MYYFDKRREAFDSKREFLKLTDPASGRPIGAMPLAHVEPLEDGSWRIMANVQVGGNRFGSFEYRAPSDDALREFFALWREDTERALAEYMRYDFSQVEHTALAARAKRAAAKAAPIGLEALGFKLDDGGG